MPSRDSLFARWLEPLAANLWLLFIFLSVLVGAVWMLGIGDASLIKHVPNRDLLAALLWWQERSDLLWLMLAAANVYLALAVREGLGTMRRWAFAVLLAVVALGWLSARSGFPLGWIHYGGRLGFKLGPVPVGLALLWFAVICGAREGLLRAFPKWSHAQIALATGVIALLTDLSLEPLAAKARGFWFWANPQAGDPPLFDPPLAGSLAWGGLAALLAFVFREREVAATVKMRSWKPIVTVAILHAVFLAAHLGRWVRG